MDSQISENRGTSFEYSWSMSSICQHFNDWSLAFLFLLYLCDQVLNLKDAQTSQTFSFPCCTAILSLPSSLVVLNAHT